ncbi:hypothetical protein SAMN05216464_1463 [Mucilaginibacter pineti]|uniref:Uncharacterized protein n=1 Tax=Mucilaginibacter pineti TaxID=1391627 RepID=A0A1G7PED3_9SPHI|nr:hypothetical protein SAMN05216464_1463 [Mucilaginibacter pineti]
MSGGQQVSAWPKHSWLRLQARGLFRYLYIWLLPYIQRLFVQHLGCCPAKSGLPLSRFSDNRYCDYRAVQTAAPWVPPIISGGLSPVLFCTRLRVSAFQHTACGIAERPTFCRWHYWYLIRAGGLVSIQKAIGFLTGLRWPVRGLIRWGCY